MSDTRSVRSRRNRIVAAIVAAAAVVAALAVLIPTVLVADPSSEQTKANPPVTTVDAATGGLLSVLGRPRTESDQLPQPAPGADQDAHSDRTPGESYELSRRAMTAGGDAVYVWPRTGGACFSTGHVSSCADAAEIAKQGVIVTFSGGQEDGKTVIRVAGIARDGVKQLEIALADGTTTTAPVSENAFAIDLTSMPRSVHWSTPDGSAHTVESPTMRAPAAGGGPAG